MRNALTFSLEGRLVSCWSRLLTALLSSWSSLYWWSFVEGRSLSCSSLSCSSFWSFSSQSFRYFNIRSNSWFRWVGRSIAAARVCTCLSNALGGFPVSWLVVAINRVKTIQLFVFETTIWLITHSYRRCQLICTKIISELIVHSCCRHLTSKNGAAKTTAVVGLRSTTCHGDAPARAGGPVEGPLSLSLSRSGASDVHV